MKNISSKSITLILIFISSVLVNTQTISDKINHTDVNLYNTEAIYFTSESVADSYLVFISVPDNYKKTSSIYPVIYVLDGDIAFGMTASIARYLEIGGNIPQSIIVGIGYGSIDKSAGNKRKRDYRPVQSGGAEDFLNFINEELIPYIDSNYRTNPGDRTIYGYSIGGLFSLYTLFTNPDIFNKYIVGSPLLDWDNYSIYNYEENSAVKLGDRKIKLFISVGSEESDEKYFAPIDSLVTRIQEREYTGMVIDAKVFDESIHLTGPAEAITYGLLSVFKED